MQERQSEKRRRLRPLTLGLLCAASLLAADAAPAATVYTGVWSAGTDRGFYAADQDAEGLEALVTKLSGEDLWLTDVETYLEDGERRWAGVWRTAAGTAKHSLVLDARALDALADKYRDEGLRLVDLETYLDERGQRRWAGLWHPGTGGDEYTPSMEARGLQEVVAKRRPEGLQLVDLETYVDELGRRRWAGVWRPASGDTIYSLDLKLAALRDLAEKRHQHGLRLVDLETYTDDGKELWAGLWRPGSAANYFWTSLYPESLSALHRNWLGRDLRLIDLEVGVRACGDVYRLPFRRNAPGWSLFKGNADDPGGGHAPGQEHAFDFVHAVGAEVLAARGGEVIFVENHAGNSADREAPNYDPDAPGYGTAVLIRHPDGTIAAYDHLKHLSTRVVEGQEVEQGELIALSGHTGNSFAPHLHFEVVTYWNHLGDSGPSLRIRFRDRDHDCWIPRVGDDLASDNLPPSG